MKTATPVAMMAIGLLLAACAGGGQKAADGVTPSEAAAGFNLQLGIAYLKQGNYALAKEKLDRALAQNPRDANIHSALALLEDRLGHADEADKYFRTALRLAPANPDISNNYAIYLCRISRTAEGVERFHAVANNAMYSTPEAAYTNAGVCLRGAGKLDEAARNFEKALGIRPNHVEAVFQLADLQLTRGRAAESRAVVERFIANFVNVTPEILLLGVRASRADGDKIAEEKFARRLRLDFPSSEQARSLSPAPTAPATAPATVPTAPRKSG